MPVCNVVGMRQKPAKHVTAEVSCQQDPNQIGLLMCIGFGFNKLKSLTVVTPIAIQSCMGGLVAK